MIHHIDGTTSSQTNTIIYSTYAISSSLESPVCLYLTEALGGFLSSEISTRSFRPPPFFIH